MHFARRIGTSLKPIVDAVYPPRCPICGDAIAEQGGLCGDCWSGMVIPGEPSCAACNRPFRDPAMSDEAICAPCLADPPSHDGIAAATLYNDVSRKLVLAFKHGRRIALARQLARMIEARLPPFEGDWLIIPVPLHRGRLWLRGFNQSALLARELANLTHCTLLVDGLLRTRPTPRLGGLGKQARRKALSGVIEVHPHHRHRIADARIILVDDVLTSGATSEACVKTLKRARAEKVTIACFSRVLDEALDL